MKRPSIDRVREALSYNPNTGELHWRTKISYKTVVGQVAGSVKNHGYINIQIDGARLYAHQFAWAWMTGEWVKEIDHKDGDGLNNRWDNLREATRKLNSGNKRKYKGPLPKGVVKIKNRGGSISYNARITINDKQIHLGSHRTPELAHHAYLEGAKKYFGEFARGA
jgi:hypothetical protein